MQTLVDFAGLLGRLEATSSRNDKIALLKEATQGPGGVPVSLLLHRALDPFVTFGVAAIDVPSASAPSELAISPTADHVRLLCDKLADRRWTGKEARVRISQMLLLLPHDQPQPVSVREAVARLLRKDLRCGVDVGGTTIEKACPGLVRSFACQLADSKMPTPSELTYPIVAEPKYDGVRTLAIIDDAGKVTLFSRNGIEFVNFAEIVEAIASLGLVNAVIDGEVLGKEQGQHYKAAMNRARGKAGKNNHVELVYQMFDILPVNAFQTRRFGEGYEHRRRTLEQVFLNRESPLLHLTPAVIVESAEELQVFHDKVVADGYEGLIVKDLNGLYEFKRSKTWRKLKPMATADLVIKDVVEGTGKYEGSLGALCVAGEHEGKPIITKVGSGFDDTLRDQFWNKRDSLIGRTAEIKYQDITQAEDAENVFSLRFPVFMRLRDEDAVGKI